MTSFLARGKAVVAGVDEAGRGALAGPVVAAAVVLHQDRPIAGLKDSKLLSHSKRRRLAAAIRSRARMYAVALAAPGEIDDLNILQASLRAMQRAVLGLRPLPDLVQVDGPQVPQFDSADGLAAEAVIGGDRLIPAISAASILAKVYRDRLMGLWHHSYPGYSFHANKGYPTPVHLAALIRLGPCPIHRRSFAPVRRAAVPGQGCKAPDRAWVIPAE